MSLRVWHFSGRSFTTDSENNRLAFHFYCSCLLSFLGCDGLFRPLAETFFSASVAASPGQSAVGWEYFRRTLEVDGAGYLLYIGRFDFIVLDIAMFYFLPGTAGASGDLDRRSSVVALPAVVLPMLPIYLTEICGNILFLVLAYLCLVPVSSFSAASAKIFSGVTWSGSLPLFCFLPAPVSFGHVFRHILVPMEMDYLWAHIEAIAGSLNTAVRFAVATLTLFFVWIYQIYLKMSDDKKKSRAVSADIMNLNQEMEELGAERTFALLGLRIGTTSGIRLPSSGLCFPTNAEAE